MRYECNQNRIFAIILSQYHLTRDRILFQLNKQHAQGSTYGSLLPLDGFCGSSAGLSFSCLGFAGEGSSAGSLFSGDKLLPSTEKTSQRSCCGFSSANHSHAGVNEAFTIARNTTKFRKKKSVAAHYKRGVHRLMDIVSTYNLRPINTGQVQLYVRG